MGIGIGNIIDEQRETINWQRARIDALEAANAWHPASEPPNDDREVLAVDIYNSLKIYRLCYFKGLWLDENVNRVDVTIWRELPAPPEDAKP